MYVPPEHVYVQEKQSYIREKGVYVPEKHVYVPETHVALGSKACCRAMDRATDHPQTCFQHQIELESARNPDIQDYSVPSRDHYYLDCWTQPKNLARIIFITCPNPVTLPGYSLLLVRRALACEIRSVLSIVCLIVPRWRCSMVQMSIVCPYALRPSINNFVLKV